MPYPMIAQGLGGLATWARTAYPSIRNAVKLYGPVVARDAVNPYYLMPAMANEIINRKLSDTTNAPQNTIDVKSLEHPFRVFSRSANRPYMFSTGLAAGGIANVISNAVLDINDYLKHEEMVKQDQAKYPGLQEWFYSSRTPLNQLPNPNRMMPSPPQTIINDAYRDPRDFTDRYNTLLTPQEEAGYRTWLTTVHPRQRNTRDYDLQGYYKAARDGIDPSRFRLAVDPEGNLHFDDRFKKPNHFTFSKDSMYSGRDGFMGGEWIQLRNGKNYKFIADPSNMWNQQELRDYFRINEPNNILAFKQR